MTKEDKEIIGYLLHHNQKMFQAGVTGGYAAPLISKGIIRQDLRRVPGSHNGVGGWVHEGVRRMPGSVHH